MCAKVFFVVWISHYATNIKYRALYWHCAQKCFFRVKQNSTISSKLRSDIHELYIFLLIVWFFYRFGCGSSFFTQQLAQKRLPFTNQNNCNNYYDQTDHRRSPNDVVSNRRATFIYLVTKRVFQCEFYARLLTLTLYRAQ